MPVVSVCPVAEEERDELKAAAERYWTELMPHAPVVRDSERRAAYFADRFRPGDADRPVWWAVVSEAKIGFASAAIEVDHDVPWAEIVDFFIEPQWRRQGYGRQLALAVIDQLRQGGVARIDLNVRHDNPVAASFWRAVGFRLALYRFSNVDRRRACSRRWTLSAGY